MLISDEVERPDLWRPHQKVSWEGTACAVCGETSNLVSHHDHFVDLVREVAGWDAFCRYPYPGTFDEEIICNDCNRLCVDFREVHPDVPMFMSLSPTDMLAFKRGKLSKESVFTRYREPFKTWATTLDAWPTFREAWMRKQKKLVARVKPERQFILDALEKDSALKEAVNVVDLEFCFTYGFDAKQLHSLAALIWYSRVGTHANSSRWYALVKNRDTSQAVKYLKRMEKNQ